MCDCFHLAFPNWHASATGEGRRLKGPEQDTDEDLECEEPEVLEGERPRPQGSSPVEEFPTTEKYVKQAEGDFYDSPTKSSKKGSKRIGFGSLFDKRSSARMNQTEDMQCDQSGMIVKTVKEACAEGLVVSGGGKDGIFVKEVKPESPASKHLNVKEGDQILSATVYFDNVTYEDALQILEHAQPYKVAFCVKRKPPPRTHEDAETMRPDITIGEEAEKEEEGGLEMRGRKKTKKQHDRISWPKFPTFSKGRKTNFKRSHSTSEAEDQRKLEMSPTTSDTESPLKSPLKSPDGKEKKKMHKMKLKMKMAGRRSKSVEETENEEALTDNIEVLDNQIIMNIAEEQVPVTYVIESPKILNAAENTDSSKTRNEYTFPTLPATESLHKVELISLDTTLKTTDITVALGEDSKDQREITELKVSIPAKDKYEIETETQLKSSTSGMRTSDPSTFDNIMNSPIITQIEEVDYVDSDVKQISQEILEKTQDSGETDMNIPFSLDIPDTGPISKSPKIGSDMEKKEKNILETESYGIRTRGPLADIATSKSHFANTVSGLEFTSSDTFTFDIQKKRDVSTKVTDTKKPITPTPVISQPKSHTMDVNRSNETTGGRTDSEVTKKANNESNFKLPKVDLSKFDLEESITLGQRDPTKVPLLKREEIEIPGMEDKGPKTKLKSPKIKEQKIEKIINISKADKPKAQEEEFNVEDVKEAVSKFPAFKLPERDITGVLVQREITIMEMKTDKTGLTPKGSPCKISSMSTEINIKLPDTMDTEKQRRSPVFSKDQAILLSKTEQLNIDEIGKTESKTDPSEIKLGDHKPKTGKMLARDKKSPDVRIKFPKREDIEIPGMEATEQSGKIAKIKVAKDAETRDKAVKDYTDTDVKADRKGHEKKSKKGKVSLPSFGIMTPDIRFPGIAIELPIKATSTKSDSDTIKEMKEETKLSLDEDNVAIKRSFEDAVLEKSPKGESCAPKLENKKALDIEADQILHHDVCTVSVKEISKQDAEEELKAEIKSKDKDTSPHKKKLPKLKMPKIGGKSMKGTTEVPSKEDVTMQENDVTEVLLDSEKRTSETEPKAYSLETDKNWSKLKMPSLDVSVPKIKMSKTEGKPKQEETGLSKPETFKADVESTKDHISSDMTQKPTKERVGKVDMRVEGVDDAREESGFRLIKFGITIPKEKTEEAGPLPEESEQSVIRVGGKTEVEQSELSHGEIKEAESKMKKRKISFPKFGFSKSESKVSDADITLTTAQDVDEKEIDFGSKTTEVEAEFKDSTDSPTKFKLPTIKLPKFGVSFPKTTDAGTDIQMPDVSTEGTTMVVELPEAKLSIELTAPSDKTGPEMTLSTSKPEVDLALPEGKGKFKDTGIPKEDGFQKKERKSPEGILFSKPDVDANLTELDIGEIPAVALSKPDIKAADTHVSLPQVDVTIPEVEIKQPDVKFTISKDEAEDKNVATVGAPVKFKLPSINLPKFGGKSSKDLPSADIDVKEPDVSHPEKTVSMTLKDDVPSVDVKDSFVIMEGQCVDMKVEEAKVKEQEVTVTLPKFGIGLPKVEAHKPDDSMDKESNAESDQAEKDPRSPTKIKLPTIKLPKFGVSFPKSTDAEFDNQVTTDQPTEEIKATKAKLSGELPSLPALKTPTPIILSDSKIKVDASTLEIEKATYAQSEKKKQQVLSSDPEFKIRLVDHGMVQEETTEDLKMQAKKLEMEVKLQSGTLDVVIPEAKEKESEIKLKKRKISFPKFGFSKSDSKIPDADTSLQKEGLFVQETEINETGVAIPAPELEVQLKNQSTSGSPSKFKLPTISLPKFDISISKTGEESITKADDDAQSETKAASAVASHDKDTGKQDTEPSRPTFDILPEDGEINIKDIDPGSQSSRFMMPKFEFSFPKLKGPEFKKGASRIDEEKTEATLKPDMERAEGKADIPEASMGMEVTKKKQKVPSSEHGFPEINVARGDGSMTVGEVDVNLESDLKIKKTEMLKDDSDTGGSPMKFRLPSFRLPKFGSSSSKVKPETTDLRGEEITLEADDAFASVEAPDVKIEFNVPSEAKGDISLPEGKLEKQLAEAPQAKLECKIDQEVDLKDPSMKMKIPGFSLPKLGFSKPDIKAPEIDFSLDTSKPEGDVKKEHRITVSNVEVELKDPTTLGGTTKYKPSINLPKIGGQSKEEKTMPVVDIAVKGPDLSGSETQMKISGEPPSLDIKGPHVATGDETVSVNLEVEDAELGGQGGKLKMPKFSIGLPKVKGFDLSTSRTKDIQQIDIKQPEITTEGKFHIPEHDSKSLDVHVKTLPEFGFSKPEVKAPETDVSIQKPDIHIAEGSMDLEEANVDIKVSKVESDQEGSTIFGSPTKFKLPSISLPKFGGKSQKVALDINVTDSELEATNITSDVSKPDIKLAVQSTKVEAKVESSVDMPEVDSKGLQVKVKRPSFSFPKFGFSKPDTSTPEVNVSVEKVEVSIPEGNVPVKEQTAEVTFPGREAEQKDLTIVSSPTKFKLTEVNLPKFGVKTSKGTVGLPSADKDIIGIEITAKEPDIKVSGQIPKIENETDVCATIREADVHLAEGKVILPQPAVDVQDLLIEGKADIPDVDLKGLDVKLKKPSFSLPKFGFSKTDVKGHDFDASQPKTDMSVQEGNISAKDQDVEITFTDEVNKQGDPTTQTKFKLPSINLPKFGFKHPKATGDISVTEVDSKEPEISVPETAKVQITDKETNIEIKGQTVDVDGNIKEMDIEGTGFKLPKFGIGMPKAKETETKDKEIKLDTGLLFEEKVTIQQPEIQNLTMEGKSEKVEIDSRGLKVKLPKLGFSKPDLKAPEVDVSLPKADMGNINVSEQSADIKLPEQEHELKEDTFGSPTRFKLPTMNFPKFGIKASKDAMEVSTEHVDIKGPEVSLPDKKFNMSGEVSSVDMKVPAVNVKDASTEVHIKGDDKKQQEGKFKIPKFGIALPTIEGSDNEVLKKTLNETEVRMPGDIPPTDMKALKLPKGSVELDMGVKGVELAEEGQFQLPQLGISQKWKSPEIDISVSKAGVSQSEVKEAKPFGIEKDVEVDKDSKGLSLKMRKPSFGFPKFGFSKSDGKSRDIQASEITADISMPEGTTEVGVSESEGKAEITSPQFGSPTKFKLPTIKFPKFGSSTPKVTIDAPKSDTEIKEMKVSSVDYETETPKVDISDGIKGKTAEIETPSVNIDIKEKEINQEGQEIKFKLPKFGISLPKVKGPEMTVTAKEVKTGTPETGITEPEIKIPAQDVRLPKVDTALEGSFSLEQKEVETEMKDDTLVSGSPSKFKMPTIKLPKFGISTPKVTIDTPKSDSEIKEMKVSSVDYEIETPKVDILDGIKGKTSEIETPSINIDIKEKEINQEGQEMKFKLPKFGISLPKVKGPEMTVTAKEVKTGTPETGITEPEIKIATQDVRLAKVDTALEGNFSLEHKEVETEMKDDTLVSGSPSKFKMPTIKLPKFGISTPKVTIDTPKSDSEIKEMKVISVDYEIETPKSDILDSIKGKTAALETPSINIDLQEKEINQEGQEMKFKLPKFGISLPKVKGPEMTVTAKEVKTGTPETGITEPEIKIAAQDVRLAKVDTALEGNFSLEQKEVETEMKDDTLVSGSPSKFKMPTIKLPKFGISTPKVTIDTPKSDSEIKEMKVISVDYETETPKSDVLDGIKGKTAEIETPSINIDLQEKEINQEGQDMKFKLPKFGISLPKVKGPEMTVTAKDIKTGTYETGIVEQEIKNLAQDVSLPKVDMALEGSSSLEQKEVETELKDDIVVSGSPSKFKLPSFKMPKFGISAQKTSEAKAKVVKEVDVPDTDINIEDKLIQVSKDKQREGEIKETTDQLPEAAVKKVDGDTVSPSKFKLPTIKMPKISISRTKSQDEDDTTINANVTEAKAEPKDESQEPGKSPRFAMPALEDVFRGFEVEFNVPTIEEMEPQMDKPTLGQEQEVGAKAAEIKDKGTQEKSKFKFKFPKLGFSQSSEESDKVVDAKIEESEKHLDASTDVKEAKTVSKGQTKTEKGGWFKFSFSSPTKTTKTDEKEEIIQQSEQAKTSHDVEKQSIKADEEPEKSSLSEVVEEIISPTLSLRSSEAFADISSIVTTEQVGLSQTSPTKVKVKYAEPTSTVGLNDVQSDVVTSTARCELISMEPHQPEKVNIPFSSDMSSTSVDTQKQMSGEIHVITTNIQAVPETQQAAILTNLDARGIHTSPLQLTLGSDSVLTVEETRVQSGQHTLVERHVVKETLHDDKETILMTQRTRVFEGHSAEPISDETASSIRRLRDTVHTDKMRFFDSVATIEEVTIVSSETSLRHMDSSADENGGK